MVELMNLLALSSRRDAELPRGSSTGYHPIQEGPALVTNHSVRALLLNPAPLVAVSLWIRKGTQTFNPRPTLYSFGDKIWLHRPT